MIICSFWVQFRLVKAGKEMLGEARLGQTRLGKTWLGRVRLGQVRLDKYLFSVIQKEFQVRFKSGVAYLGQDRSDKSPTVDCAHEHFVEFDHFKIRPNQAFDHFHRFTIDKSRSDSSRQRFGEQSVRSDYQRILNSLKAVRERLLCDEMEKRKMRKTFF